MRLPSKKFSIFSATLFVLCSVLAVSQPADAVDYLASIGHAVLDPDPAGAGAFPAYNTDDGILIDAQANRSYVCQGVPSADDSAFYFGLSVVGQGGSDPETVTARAIGNMTPVITEGTGANGKTRISFAPTTNNRFRLNIASTKVGGEVVRIICRETTFCGGFNTNGTRFVFLEFVNRSNRTLNVSGTLTTFDGQQANIDSFPIPAFRRRDIALHTLVEELLGENERSFGGMVFAFDGTGPSLNIHAVRYASRDDEAGVSAGAFVLRGARRLRRCTILGQ